MPDTRRYSEVVAWTATPAFILGAAFSLPAVMGLSLVMLAVAATADPAGARRAFIEGGRGLVILALLAFALGLLALGGFVLLVGISAGVAWMVLAGSALGCGGLAATRVTVVAFFVPKPVKALPVPDVVAVLPTPTTHVEIIQAPPPPPPPAEVVKKKPRELVLWAGMLKPAKTIDQGFYMISGPPGRGKSTLKRLALKSMIQEVLDPESESVLICFDPKREDHAWIASQLSNARDSNVPLHLFCPSDQRTCTLDYAYDYYSPADKETFSHSMRPATPNLLQPFFENAERTIVAELAGAIHRKLGYWDLRLLMNVLSNPGFIKTLVSSDAYARFVQELLSAKGEETAQNIQMEITSILAKWRKVAAHLSHVKKGRTLSLERFLSKRGILVLQKDESYREQHNAMNAMLLMRIGQLLMKMQKDPTGKRKVYIVIDEFPSLGYIPGFVDMLRELRSRGVIFLITWQSWANIEQVWKEEAYSIQNCLQNYMILGSGDPKDAEHAAKLIGKARGFEAEEGRSTSEGTSENETDGTSDTDGWSNSKTRAAGFATHGFTATDTEGTSGSRTTNYSKARGVSHQESKSFTWRYFERDIKSPTEIMRSPWPTREGGFHGVGYCVGEPAACDFIYESDSLEEQGLFEKNDFIPDYMEWPSEKFQLLEDLTQGELERLGLADVDPADSADYPTLEGAEAEPKSPRPQPPAVHDEDLVSCDWDAIRP